MTVAAAKGDRDTETDADADVDVDVVAANDLNAVGDLVTSQIHTIDGIVRTVTCLSVGAT